MPEEPIEPISVEEQEEEVLKEAPQKKSPPPNIDAEDFGSALRIEKEEEFLEPVSFKKAISQKIKDLKPDRKNLSAEVFEKSESITEKAGVTFLHQIPVIGLIFALFAKRRISNKITDTQKQFKIINQARMKILIKQSPSDVNRQRGIDPKLFKKNNPKQDSNLLLANTLEYAQLQMQKRFSKLQKNSLATDIQTIGTGVSSTIVAAPVGMAISLVGTAAKGYQSLKSIKNFFSKIRNGTLGVERNHHASVLFDLAKMHLEQKPLDQDRAQASAQAFKLLQDLKIPLDSSGFDQIRELLKS